MHSTSCLLGTVGAATVGSGTLNAPLTIRSPYEPVSTCTLGMLWQAPPGTHTVTVTVGILMTSATPGPTVIGAVFAAVAATG